MIRFACPKCDTAYSAAEEHAGKRTTCKKCGEKFLIPSPDDGAELPYDVESSTLPTPPVPEPEPSFFMPPAPEAPPPEPSVPVELAPCPQCHAKMSVRPEDVGFDIQCPFCQTVFRGVAATEAPDAAPVEPEPEGVEIAPCPKCRAELTVAPDDLGGEVECPFCQTVYKAEIPKPKANTLLARPSKAPPPPPPKKKSAAADDEDAPAKPIRMKVEAQEDDDEDDRPRRKRRKKKRKYYDNDPYARHDERLLMTEPSNGTACLLLGLAAFLCCPILAFWAIPQCNDTISKVNSGMMDSSAKPLAITGLVLSYMAIGWVILNIVGFCIGGLMGGGR